MNLKKILFITFIFVLFLVIIFFVFGESLINQGMSTEAVNVTQPMTDFEKPASVKIPILIYHHIRKFSSNDSENDRTFVVPPADFAKQMNYLKENGYQTLTFIDFKNIFAGQEKLPEKPIIITFDDGIVNQFTKAFPILKENNQQAVFFIFTNPISKSVNYMTWENLQEMKAYGMEIGSHGHYHSDLTKITTTEEWEREIQKNRELIKENLGDYPTSLAYPFGSYNESVITYVKNNGYDFSRAITHGKIHTPDDFYKLDGYFITADFDYFKNIVD